MSVCAGSSQPSLVNVISTKILSVGPNVDGWTLTNKLYEAQSVKTSLNVKSSKFSKLHTLNLQSVKKLSCKIYKVISIIHENMVF